MKSQEIAFKVMRSRMLVPGQISAIQALVNESVAADFSERPEEQRDYFVGAGRKMRRNPNRGIGGSLLHRRQAYARPLSILALRDDELIAYLPVADNASSQTGGLKGIAQRQAQLRFPEVTIGSTTIPLSWRWFGLCAMSNDLRQELRDTDTQTITPIDVMLTKGVIAGDLGQRVSTYPLQTEGLWKASLSGAGFRHQAEHDYRYQPFGSQAAEATLEHWTAASGGAILDAVLQKQDPDMMLPR